MTASKKVALITGAANGIGEATARLFAKRGYAVVMVDIADRGAVIAKEIVSDGGVCDFFVGDVSAEKDVIAAVEKSVKKHGRIDVLNNNAGIVLVARWTRSRGTSTGASWT